MNEPDRIARFEARLARVEEDLRNLLHALEAARARDPDVVSRMRAPKREPVADPPPSPASTSPTSATSPTPATAATSAAGPDESRTDAPPAGKRRPVPERDLEAWLGENGLLAVGVLALVAAVGFLLKHAFDQGWISPAVRVLAGLLIGLVTAGYGERIQRRGLRRFGAALVGAGAAIAYLAIWAAAGPYAFVSSGLGITALAVVSGLVLASAWRSDEPYLGAVAATGAFLAPFIVGDPAGSADLLLGYAGLVSIAVGWVAAVRDWRLTFGIVLAGFVGTAVAVTGRADPAWLGAFVAGLGAGAIALSRSRGWGLHEFVAWSAAWLLLLVAADHPDGWRGWVYAGVPALLVAPGWLAAVRGRSRNATGDERSYRDWMLGAAALAWTLTALAAVPSPGDEYPALVAALIALVYVVPGLSGRIPAALAAGLGVLAIGVFQQWEASAVSLGWAGLIAATAWLARGARLGSVRWIGLVLGVLAGRRLFTGDLYARPELEPAFVGRWSLALYGLVAALALLALGESDETGRETEREAGRRTGYYLGVATWLLTGLLVLAGGTVEIMRLEISSFAAGLIVSAFWLLYAGALLAWGFRADSRAVRVTGLVVAALAVAKIAFYDLATLDALYRVGSFALLAVISLAGARAYHGRAHGEGSGESGSVGASEPGG
ncbi:MAG: DUF2339 domain-containing protein [Gemmatimonadota bacterium]